MAHVHQANANIDYLNGVVSQQNVEIATLKDQLAMAKALAAGREAQFDEFARLYPASPLMGDSGQRFASGKVKTNVRLIFEAAFDRVASGLGIQNPSSRRTA